MSERELFDAMENGELLAAEVLPKVAKELYKASQAGGAYEAALKSLRVQKGKMVNEAQQAGYKIFQSGFEEGLADLYRELQEQLGQTGKAQEDIGNIYKRFFQLLTLGVKAVVPLLQSLIHSMSFIADTAALAAKGYKEIYDALERVNPALGKTVVVASGIALAFQSIFGKVMLVIGAVEELAALFDDKLVGAIEKKLGYQINLSTGMATDLVKGEGGLYSGKSRKMGMAEAGSLAGMLGIGAAGLYGGKKISSLLGGKELLPKTTALIAAINANTRALLGKSTTPSKKKNKGSGAEYLHPVLMATALSGSSGNDDMLKFNINKAKSDLEALKVKGAPEGTFTDADKAANLIEKLEKMEQQLSWRTYPTKVQPKEMINLPMSPLQPSQNINLSGLKIDVNVNGEMTSEQARQAGNDIGAGLAEHLKAFQ